MAVTFNSTDWALAGTAFAPDPVPVTCIVIDPPDGGEAMDRLAAGRAEQYVDVIPSGSGLSAHLVSVIR
jgi:hypothetical protein